MPIPQRLLSLSLFCSNLGSPLMSFSFSIYVVFFLGIKLACYENYRKLFINLSLKKEPLTSLIFVLCINQIDFLLMRQFFYLSFPFHRFRSRIKKFNVSNPFGLMSYSISSTFSAFVKSCPLF